MNIFSIIGLSLDIIGVVFIFIASDKLSNAIAELTEEITGTIGSWQDGPLNQNFIERLKSTRKLASILNMWGLFLLILGFTGQILGCFTWK